MALWFGQKVCTILRVLKQHPNSQVEDLVRLVTTPIPSPGFYTEKPGTKNRVPTSVEAILACLDRTENWRLIESNGSFRSLSRQGERCLDKTGEVNSASLEGQISDVLAERTEEWGGRDARLDVSMLLDLIYSETSKNIPSKRVIWNKLKAQRPGLFNNRKLNFREFGDLLSLLGRYGSKTLVESVKRLYFTLQDKRVVELGEKDDV